MPHNHDGLSSKRNRARTAGFVVLVAVAPIPTAAHALQPLEEFLAGARQANTDLEIARIQTEQRHADALSTLGEQLPSLSARGVYTRNQYEAAVSTAFATAGSDSARSITIQARNQLDAYLQADVPIVDVGSWERMDSARATERAALAHVAATRLDVQKQVVKCYYQLVAAMAVSESAQRSLAAAEENLKVVEARISLEVATDLDVNRARAEVQRALQNIAEGDVTIRVARRTLHTLTGIEPQGESHLVEDDLHPELPLASFSDTQSVPSVREAVQQRSAAEHTAAAAKLSFVPKLTGSIQEHLTNAEGFTGHASSWVGTLTASWKLDISTLENARSQAAAAAIAKTREAATRQRVLDQVHESWVRVGSGIARSRAARAEAQSSALAVGRARERYVQGLGTSLELVQAERDAFAAEVSRIQADADLLYARAALRIDSGTLLSKENS